MAISWPTAARSVVSTSCTASGGRPAARQRRRCTSRASARLRVRSLPSRRAGCGVAALDRERGGVDRSRSAGSRRSCRRRRAARACGRPGCRSGCCAVDDLADRVGQRGDLLAAFGHRARWPRRTASGGRAWPARGRRPRAASRSCRLAARSRAASRRTARGDQRQGAGCACALSARAIAREAARARWPTCVHVGVHDHFRYQMRIAIIQAAAVAMLRRSVRTFRAAPALDDVATLRAMASIPATGSPAGLCARRPLTMRSTSATCFTAAPSSGRQSRCAAAPARSCVRAGPRSGIPSAAMPQRPALRHPALQF